MIAQFLPWFLVILFLLAAVVVLRVSNVVRYIPNDEVGIVEKLLSRHGSVTSGFIALNGEAGFQPEILRGGLHLFFPFVYRVHKQPLVTIPQGELGYVFARGGLPLGAAQALGANHAEEDFQDVRAFLSAGGQKGPQRRVLREGTYALNLAQFIVFTSGESYGVDLEDIDDDLLEGMHKAIKERDGYSPVIIRDNDDQLGVVTVHDGPSLDSGEIIAPVVADHDNYQHPAGFLAAGGRRGRQLQVLVEGTYFINRLFATVEFIPKTIIDIGTVGVVISYTGPKGDDVSGQAYKHGELVATGARGVWRDPMLPGKYAFNTYAGKIVTVPTTNFVLKWVKNAAGDHQLDSNLSEVNLITKDAFEPVLPLSVVLHIDYKKAPELVQRFGNVQQLVEQTLDPMVSAYFKNVGQQKTLIELLQERNQIQEQAGADMKTKLGAYTLEFQEVLIGTPRPREGDKTIEQILIQLRDRQIAVEQQITYASQQAAATKERELNEAVSTAAVQEKLTQSAIEIQIQNNEGAAALARAKQAAETIRVTAEAEAGRVFVIGEAQARAARLQVEAYGGPQYRLAEEIAAKFFAALEEGGQPIVPQILVAGGSGGDAGQAAGSVPALLSGLLSASLLKDVAPTVVKPNGQAIE